MILLAATLFIATAADAPAVAHERTFGPTEIAERAPAPQSVWRRSSGDALHLQSRLSCPDSFAVEPDFERFDGDDLAVHDAFGLDVSCSFTLASRARLTLFLTKRVGRSLEQDFDAARVAALARDDTTGAKPLAGPTPMPVGPPDFLGAAYAVDGYESAVWTTDLSGWTLKYRAVYPAAMRADILAIVANLTRIAETTAGAHLSACVAAAPVKRKGTQIVDRELGTRLSLIAGMSEQAGTENITPPTSNERWCVEDVVQIADAPLVYWRNIASNGNDGPLDRLTLMTIEQPPTWLLSANATANMLVDKANVPSPLIHQLTQARDGKTLMFAYYRGRPALATLAPFVRGVVIGKTNPLASYDPKTNAVTLPKSGPKR